LSDFFSSHPALNAAKKIRAQSPHLPGQVQARALKKWARQASQTQERLIFSVFLINFLICI